LVYQVLNQCIKPRLKGKSSTKSKSKTIQESLTNTKLNSILGLVSVQKSELNQLLNTKSSLMTKQQPKQSNLFRTDLITNQRYGTGQIFGTGQPQSQQQSFFNLFASPIPNILRDKPVPPPPPDPKPPKKPFPPKPPKKGFGFSFSRSSSFNLKSPPKSKYNTNKGRYAPTITSIVGKVTGSPTKRATSSGLGIRPLKINIKI